MTERVTISWLFCNFPDCQKPNTLISDECIPVSNPLHLVIHLQHPQLPWLPRVYLQYNSYNAVMKDKISQSPVLAKSSDEHVEYSCFFVMQSQRTRRPAAADTVEGSFFTSQRPHPSNHSKRHRLRISS
jgi:hypothetical protein